MTGSLFCVLIERCRYERVQALPGVLVSLYTFNASVLNNRCSL